MLSYDIVLAAALLFSPLFADYVHIEKGLVRGKNIVQHKFKSLYECKQLCDANEECLAIEYANLQHGGGYADRDPGDCLLQSSADYTNYDGGYWNIDLYVKTTYAHFEKACVRGQNIELHKAKSIVECQELCDARCDCEAFEYGVAHGGSNPFNHEASDCQLQSSARMTDCDGAHHNFDLWVKRDGATCDPSPAPTSQPTRTPTKAPTRSPTSYPTSTPTRTPTFQPTASGYERIPRGCVMGANIVLYQGKTVSECEDLCDADERCKAFEYGVMHGGNGKYRPGDCQLQSSSRWENCNGGHFNLDLYIKGTYERFPKSCVYGSNIQLYQNKSVQECRELCDALEACKAFEYGVAYGGGGPYKAKDCQLQSSAEKSTCDGGEDNLDLYVKGYRTAAEHHRRLQVLEDSDGF